MTLLFKKKYIQQIINGQKTATRRKTKPMVKIGGPYKLRTDNTTYTPELIQVTRLPTKTKKSHNKTPKIKIQHTTTIQRNMENPLQSMEPNTTNMDS